jgi:uncharacterized membrane protein
MLRNPLLFRSGRLAAIVCLIPLAGCAGMNHAQEGALVGTTVGALAGGILGHQSGNTGAGAVLGAGAGMLAGTLVGDAEDAREERDWAMQEVRQAQYEREIAQPPLSNTDLIYMAQNGLSDDVILNAVKTRGGRFDVDPTALVQLKQSGVSDAVIAEVQRHGGRIVSPRVSPTNTRVVYVEPYYAPPPVRWSFHYGPSFGGWHHCHHW